MANELIHTSQGTVLTQAEFEAVGLHVLNSQATGDIIYASSASQLSRLGIGATNSVLQTVGGIPSWVTNPTIASPTFTGTVTTTSITNDSNSIRALGSTNALYISGGNNDNNAEIILYGRDVNGGALTLRTTNNASTATQRFNLSGQVDTAILTLNDTTVTGLVITSAAGILITPSGAATSTEGMLYYDSTAHKLKIRTAAGYETVTSS